MTFVAVVGMGAGSALADVAVTSGSTVLSSSFSSSSGTINMSGGTLSVNSTSKQTATSAAVTVSNNIVLATGTTNTFLGNSYSYTTTATPPVTGTSSFVGTLSGIISGAGNLNVSGSSIYLTGANTYTGTTTVQSGATLYVGNGNDYGTLGNTGSVSVAGTLNFYRSDTYTYNGNITGAGTVIQSGGGTLILNGNSVLTGTSTMSTGGTPVVNLGYLGKLRVSKGWIMIGDASHSSASVTVPLANILSGAGMSGFGTLNGDLINGDDTPGTVSNRNSNTSQLVGGILMPGDGTTTGTFTINGNYTQGTYGALLITATPTSTSKLVVSGTANINGQLSVSATKGSYTAGLYPILTANRVSGTFKTILTGTPDDANAFGIYYKSSEVDLVVAPKTIGQVYNDLVVQNFDAALSLNDMVLDHTSGGSCSDCRGFSVWGRGYNGTDGLKSGNGVSAFSNHTVGLIGGVDYRFPSGMSFHAALGDSEGHIRLQDKSASGANTQIYLSAAAHIPAGAVVFDTSYFFLDAATDVSRTDSLGNALTSTVKDTVIGGSVQVGVPLMRGDLLPFGKVTYSYLTGGAATEVGASPMALSVKHGHQTTGRYQLGVRFAHTYDVGDGFSLRPQVTLGGEANDRVIGKTNPISMSSGALFFATSAEPDRFAAVGQVGVDFTSRNLTFQAGASGRKSGNQDQVLFNFGAAYHF